MRVLRAGECAEIRRAPARGEDDEWSFRPGGELLRNIKPGHVGKQHVQEDDVRTKSADRGDRRCTVLSVADDDVARRLEQLAGKTPEARMVVDDECGRWHDVIVPQPRRLILLDFPELARSQGNARRPWLFDFLVSLRVLTHGRRRENDRTRRSLHRRARHFRRGRSGPLALDGNGGLCNATGRIAANRSNVSRPASRRLDSEHDFGALEVDDHEEQLLSAITDGVAWNGSGVTGAELPSGTVTFLFTDIEGSTRLLGRLGERYGSVLCDHQRLLRDAFSDACGREVDTQGDAFLAVFPRAKDAVAAALAGQRALANHAWPADVRPRVRMGLHTGESAAARDRYIGLSVHRAARICAAGHGGQVLLSRATYAILADDVLTDITFHDLGEHRLKDLDHTERIYQLLVPDLPRHFPPLQTESQSTSEALPRSPATGRRALRVVVADDSVLLREGLSRLLAEAGFNVVVARAADADELLREVARAEPDVALTDIKMPPAHIDEGLVAAMEIRRLHPKTAVLVLSHYLDSGYAIRLLEEYPERVGYLLKDRVYDVAVLGDAIRRLAEGECVVDPTIVSRLVTHTRTKGPFAGLSASERRLFEFAAEGRPDEAIGRQLGLTNENVEPALQDVFAKLGLTGTLDELRRVVTLLEYLRSV